MKTQKNTVVAAAANDGFTRTTLAKPKAPSEGQLKIVRPSALAKEGITGVVASGILEKSEPNKFNPAKNDYFIRNADGTLYILNETQGIKEQLGQDGVVGLNIEVVYNGKLKTKNGKGFHDFSCSILSK